MSRTIGVTTQGRTITVQGGSSRAVAVTTRGAQGPAGTGGGVPEDGAVGDVLTRQAGGLTAWKAPGELDMVDLTLFFNNALL